jgi:hypothetical protein
MMRESPLYVASMESLNYGQRIGTLADFQDYTFEIP